MRKISNSELTYSLTEIPNAVKEENNENENESESRSREYSIFCNI